MKTLSALKAANPGRIAQNILRMASNVADGETVTIGSEVYEFDTTASPGNITAGRIRVDVSGSQAPDFAGGQLMAAINKYSQQGLRAQNMNTYVAIWGTDPVKNGAMCSETMAGANNAFVWSTLWGGTDPGPLGMMVAYRNVSSIEVAIGEMFFKFPFPVVAAMVNVRTGSTQKAWGGTVSTNTAGFVRVTNNGTVDFTSSDTVYVFAFQ